MPSSDAALPRVVNGKQLAYYPGLSSVPGLARIKAASVSSDKEARMSSYRRVVPLVLFLATVGSFFSGSMSSLLAQTAPTEKARKAEPARGIEELRRAMRSPQAARERFEAMREAQKQIEAARKKDQSPKSPVRPKASTAVQQSALSNQ